MTFDILPQYGEQINDVTTLLYGLFCFVGSFCVIVFMFMKGYILLVLPTQIRFFKNQKQTAAKKKTSKQKQLRLKWDAST